MTDPDLQKKDPADPAQASEPVVSKPYIMPDDPEPVSVESLTKEVAEARDKMLRTLAEMENLRQRTRRELGFSQRYPVSPVLPATCWISPPTFSGRWMPCRPKHVRRPTRASRD